MTKAEIIKKVMEEVLNGRFLQIDDCKQITTMIITPEELQKILEEVLPEDKCNHKFDSFFHDNQTYHCEKCGLWIPAPEAYPDIRERMERAAKTMVWKPPVKSEAFERLRNAVKEAMPCMEERVDREKRFKEQYEGQTFDFGSGKLKFYAAPNDCINIRGIPKDEAWFFMNGKIVGIFKFNKEKTE